jgi:hypothetical protein
MNTRRVPQYENKSYGNGQPSKQIELVYYAEKAE